MNLPPTSLLIASRNRPQLLQDTVDSILSGNTVPKEIVIIDQSRTPHPTLDNRKPLRECEVRYHWHQSVGLSAARNAAIRIARYDFLAITDDDVFVDPDWLSRLINGLVEAGPKSVISGKVLPSEIPEGTFSPSTKVDDEPAVYEGRIQKDALWGQSIAMRRSVIADIGFFDERLGPGAVFPSADDNDYGFRLLEAGYRILYLPSAVVYHRAWRRQNDFLPLRWEYGLGRGGFYAKYFNIKDRYLLKRMFHDVQNHLVSFPYQFRRDRLKAYGDLILVWGMLVGMCRWLIRYGFKPAMDDPSAS